MANAKGSNSKLIRVREPIFGELPPLPIPFQQRFSTTDFMPLARAAETDPTVTGDRQPQVHRSGNKTLTGSLESVLAMGAVDDLLESVMMAEWVPGAGDTSSLIIGSELISFTMEEQQRDINDQERNSGLVANTVSLVFPLDGPCMATFVLLGKTKEIPDDALTDEIPYDDTQHFNNIGASFTLGTITESDCVVQSVTIDVNNNMEANVCWGEGEANNISEALSEITGTIELFYADQTALVIWLEDEETDLTVEVVDPDGETMIFEVPRVKLTAHTNPFVEGSRVITIPFVGLFDETLGTSFRITRSSDTLPDAPVIDTQPTDETVTEPAAAAFAVAATGDDLRYQWQINTGSGFVNVPGEDQNNIAISPTDVSMDGDQFRVFVANAGGTIESDTVTLNVSAP